MKQLKANRTTTKAPIGSGGSTLAAAGRESVAQGSNFKSQTIANSSTDAFIEGSPVEVLLFGFKRRENAFQTSFNASVSSDSFSSNAHVVQALRHVLKLQPLTRFNISTIGADGRRLYSDENTQAAGGMGKLDQDSLLQTKIQMLLDQRKPPNEEVPSLTGLYDDDLNPITDF